MIFSVRLDLLTGTAEILAPGIEFISWRESYAYARRAEEVLPVLAQARSTDPVSAVGLALHAMRGCWGVLNQSDDCSSDLEAYEVTLGMRQFI